MDSVYLFNTGKNYQAYKYFGSFPEKRDGQEGYRFAVWAPHAKQVYVMGDFNNWEKDHMPLSVDMSTGVWTGFFPNLKQWQKYKYVIITQKGDELVKSDPFARHQETRPGTASILYDPDDYVWEDDKWLNEREDADKALPLNIYEMHLGSWKQYEDGNVYNYKDLAPLLVKYLCDMGYNAVEFMPLSEYPFDASWGYQVTGYFSLTSRYGTPAQFKYLVDELHKAGIRVIMDWVPAHFPKDSFALARFDGEALYEYADTRLGEHADWGTLVFDYSKSEVVSFLASSAWFWIEECHIDGLRIDAVSSMLYLDYSRTDFVKNKDGGNINLEVLDFFKRLNTLIKDKYPSVFMMAEESTSYPYITHPIEKGGLGFTHKWNMGWMHDTLEYMGLDYIYRKDHHNQITFSMEYAFSEKYILAFSHDEVVHGKKSLLEKMPGDIWRKFASLRLVLMYQMAHPGAKLNFMGYELASGLEWRFYEGLEWNLLENENNKKFHSFVRDLNHLYLDTAAFWEKDDSWEGFSWQQVSDYNNSVLAFGRYDFGGARILCIYNMTPATLPNYSVKAIGFGRYKVLLNSDDLRYGGSGYWCEDSTDKLFYTDIPSAKEAEVQMLKLRKSVASKEKQLIAKRKDIMVEMRTYFQELRKLREQGVLSEAIQADNPLSQEQLEAAVPMPVLEINELSPVLTLDLPPLSAIYLKWEDISEE